MKPTHRPALLYSSPRQLQSTLIGPGSCSEHVSVSFRRLTVIFCQMMLTYWSYQMQLQLFTILGSCCINEKNQSGNIFPLIANVATQILYDDLSTPAILFCLEAGVSSILLLRATLLILLERNSLAKSPTVLKVNFSLLKRKAMSPSNACQGKVSVSYYVSISVSLFSTMDIQTSWRTCVFLANTPAKTQYSLQKVKELCFSLVTPALMHYIPYSHYKILEYPRLIT